MLVTFGPAQHPEGVTLEVLAVGRGLDDLSDGDLAALLARARPMPPPQERQDLDSETRARKKGDR